MTMILYWIAFIGLFFAILNLLPSVGTINTNVEQGLELIISNMKAWNELFPIDQLLVIVGLMATFYMIKYGWRATKWVIHIVRGSSHS